MPHTGAAVVVGGGIGGLTAAVALRRVGWTVTVLERAEAFTEVGAGITVMSNALRCLDAVGLGDAVRRGSRAQSPGGLRTPSGRWLARLDGAAVERELGVTAAALHRADLHRILLSALPADATVTGATPHALLDAGGAVEVRYTRDGGDHAIGADLVVGADGIRSWVRAQRWPEAAGPVYDGSTAWRAVTTDPVPGGVDISQTWGRGQEFGHLPLPDGRVYWYGAATVPPGERADDDELAEVRRRFGTWHRPIPALLAATEPDAVLRHDVHRLPALRTYVRGRVALLGDAAHAMTPNLGQGGAQAIEDAVVLAAAVSTCADLGAALAEYDRQRRPRTQAVSRAATVMARSGQQLHNPVAVAVRNAAVALTPPRVALRSMAHFGTWSPPELRAVEHG
jgi:2-polyprenyl-6-methoxyphenol hydroxylase-like FAD-dependent oxidoreductase